MLKFKIDTYVLPVKSLTEEEIENEYDETSYYAGKQCGSCKGYRELDSDYGTCFKKESIFKNRLVFEHFACKKFEFMKGDR